MPLLHRYKPGQFFDEDEDDALTEGILCKELGAATRLSMACRSRGQGFRRALNVLEGMRAAPSKGAEVSFEDQAAAALSLSMGLTLEKKKVKTMGDRLAGRKKMDMEAHSKKIHAATRASGAAAGSRPGQAEVIIQDNPGSPRGSPRSPGSPGSPRLPQTPAPAVENFSKVAVGGLQDVVAVDTKKSKFQSPASKAKIMRDYKQGLKKKRIMNELYAPEYVAGRELLHQMTASRKRTGHKRFGVGELPEKIGLSMAKSLERPPKRPPLSFVEQARAITKSTTYGQGYRSTLGEVNLGEAQEAGAPLTPRSKARREREVSMAKRARKRAQMKIRDPSKKLMSHQRLNDFDSDDEEPDYTRKRGQGLAKLLGGGIAKLFGAETGAKATERLLRLSSWANNSKLAKFGEGLVGLVSTDKMARPTSNKARLMSLLAMAREAGGACAGGGEGKDSGEGGGEGANAGEGKEDVDPYEGMSKHEKAIARHKELMGDDVAFGADHG